jgi:peptide/nickel transport system permease protein
MPPPARAAVATGPGVPEPAVAARSSWGHVLHRLLHDPVAILSFALLTVVILGVFAGAPLAAHLLGHGPNDVFLHSVGDGLPAGPWTHVRNLDESYVHTDGTTLFVLGSDGYVGRDELLRLLYGGQTSLEVAVGATIIAMFLGTILGALGGYFGGLVDSVVLRAIDFLMAFPVILVAIAIGSSASDRFAGITLGGVLQPGVIGLAGFIGVLTCFYPARIVRVQVMTLSEQPFIEGARMVGASHRRILFGHMAPHLIGPLAVYSTIIFATNIMLEASISLLGAGIQPPNASWGNMLATNFGTLIRPGPYVALEPRLWTAVFPTVAILLTLVAAVLVGEQLRKAFDPRAR